MAFFKVDSLVKVTLEYDSGFRFEVPGDQVIYAEITREWNEPPILHLDIVAAQLDEKRLGAGLPQLTESAQADAKVNDAPPPPGH